jgi:endoglycosylceramidase
MKASAYVGRVGGLAVALGIGMALAAGAGSAWADTDSSTPAPASGHETKAKTAVKPGTNKTAAAPSTAALKPPRVATADHPSSTAAVTFAGPARNVTPSPAHDSALLKQRSRSGAGNTPTAPVETPLALTMLAATRRETSAAPQTHSAAAATAAAQPAPINPTIVFQQLVYTPIHTVVEAWIDSDLGQQVDGVINTLAGSYVIGDGTAGTATNPNGGAGGWLLGDGGAGWAGAEAGVAGGSGGRAGLMGLGGAGGAGGNGVAGGVGGAGGSGGTAAGLVFGIGGSGGDGGDGTDGGRGGNGGSGAALLGSGGAGGDAGNSGVGGDATGLPALGGAGGNAGWLGSHGAAGQFGTLPGGASAQAGDDALSTTGTWLTNSAGQVVILHGVNEVYKLPPYLPSASGFGEDDAEFLAANGFNVVRLGVIWAAVEPEPGVIDTAYLASIKQTVQTLADNGIYTIVDMHQDNYSTTFGGEGAPTWATQTVGLPNPDLGFPGNYFLNPAENYAWDRFWSNSDAPNGLGLEDNYALAWQNVASSLVGTSGVIGS